jgi:hypothetical protein
LLLGLLAACKQESISPAGHWEGSIALPRTALAIRVDLESTNGAWAGRIDIPAQGLRGFRLGGIEVGGNSAKFNLPGIPGDPTFAGKVDRGGQVLRGDFTQRGQHYAFTLERKPAPAALSGETPSRGAAGAGLAGHWQGSLKPSPIMELRLVLEITNNGGVMSGVMVSVDQGGSRLPITAIKEQNGPVSIEVNSINGTFNGKLSADGSELDGTWMQGAGVLPLVFKRLAAAPSFNRLQDPKPPFPYDAVEVVFSNAHAGVQLAGTFTQPRGGGPYPAVVLISGSGPQDRDEAIMGHRPFLVLADHLTRRGIAVLRYDDRGVGRSTGNFVAATHPDFVADALAGVAWLKTRDGVDPKRIGLVGHSEGGLIAPLAAVQQPADIAFLVLLAGVGVPMEELLLRQGKDLARVMGADADSLRKNAETQIAIFKLLKQELERPALERQLRELFKRQMTELTDEQRKLLGSEAAVEGQIQTLLTPWFRALLAYDPRPVLREVRCPVLALNGERDLQVAAKDNLDAIATALDAGGNRNVKTAELPGLNHLFQSCATGAVAEYGQIEETFSPIALELIAAWVLDLEPRLPVIGARPHPRQP